MNVIGISGFGNAVTFKRAYWPDLEEREYRITQGHDAAAALIVDGVPVAAAAEERFNRQKHTGAFPIGAVQYCLDEARLSVRDIDELVHSFDYYPAQRLFAKDPITAALYRDVFSREALLMHVTRHLPELPPARVHQVSHHLAHAASAYFTSGWDECLVVVIDGMGETQSASIFRARDRELNKLGEISSQDSIGVLYGLITLQLGFDFNSDEYKIMGLAPYGDPGRFRAFFQDAVQLGAGGSVNIPILRLNRTRDERENYVGTRQYLRARLLEVRRPDDEIRQEHCDVAAALQECLERVILHLCGCFGAKSGLRRLALAGGVALNCTANGRLMRSGLFDQVYIQPAAADDGSALGAALYRGARAGEVCNSRSPTPFYGPAYSDERIEEALSVFQDLVDVVRFLTVKEACVKAAHLIAGGSVIGWFRGRMEFGPRALGNRSILADPGRPEMRDRINALVKMREAFRPFAPAVSLEQVHIWFDVPSMTELPFMLATVDVRKEHRPVLSAITHVDGSARVQTVSNKDNKDFHALLQEVGKVTGREMVLNTSFNVKGQPIVNTPEQALQTFLGTGVDFLFLNNTLLSRRPHVRVD